MKSLTLIAGVLIAVALALPAHAQKKSSSPSSNARMYKCLDEKGKVFYTDNPRVECYSGQEMNRQGVIVRKAGEKPAADAAKEVKKGDAKTPPAGAARRDRALMATYTSEAEIDAARDRSLAMPRQAIKVAEGKLDKTNAELFELKKHADGLAAKQKALPPDLLEDVQSKQKQIALLEKDLTQKKAHADEITTRFESDKQRFRELKGLTTADSTKTN